MYTSKERVVRDGHLVAFEGEVMSDEEAAARGLDAAPEKDSSGGMTVKQLKAALDEAGVEYPKDAKKQELQELLDAHEGSDVYEE